MACIYIDMHLDYEHTHLLFQHIEIIDDYSDKQIQREERAAHYEYNKINICIQIGLALWLQINATCIHGIGHHFHPALESGHLQQCKVSHADMIKCYFRVDPRIVELDAFQSIVNDLMPFKIMVIFYCSILRIC